MSGDGRRLEPRLVLCGRRALSLVEGPHPHEHECVLFSGFGAKEVREQLLQLLVESCIWAYVANSSNFHSEEDGLDSSSPTRVLLIYPLWFLTGQMKDRQI